MTTERRILVRLAATLAVLGLLAGAAVVAEPLWVAAHSPRIYGSALRYSTYLGGTSEDQANAVGVDGDGNVYVAGVSDSPGLDSHRLSLHGHQSRAFVVKMTPNGQTVRYAVTLPASTIAIAVDRVGDVYVTGSTADERFPVLHALQPRLSCAYYPLTCEHAFVAKLSPGGKLLYSTYLGGTCEDWGSGIAVDDAGDAYITGSTESSDFPTVHPYQRRYAGPYRWPNRSCLGSGAPNQPWGDAFVAKLAPSGNRLVYSTFLGGLGNDGGSAIAVDERGDAYITGTAGSRPFPTLYALAGQGGGVAPNIFVAKFSARGHLVFSTYFGGRQRNVAGAIGVDRAGNVYLTGSTDSQDLPTVRAFDRTYAGGRCPDYTDGFFACTDAFVVKLRSDGRKIVYSTYLGGSRNDAGYGIAADAVGNAYVIGSTQSADFPVHNAAQRDYQGGHCGHTACSDAFITKLSPTGRLVFSTFLGGGGDEADNIARAVAVGPRGVWTVGITSSTTFPTVKSLQDHNGGSADAFVAQFFGRR